MLQVLPVIRYFIYEVSHALLHLVLTADEADQVARLIEADTRDERCLRACESAFLDRLHAACSGDSVLLEGQAVDELPKTASFGCSDVGRQI